jgi:uncharacterized LabA/DUF88 family protein
MIEKTGFILIDFDNFLKKPMDEILETELEFFFSTFIQNLVSESNDYERITIRLYGGWYQDNIITQRAELLQQKLANISIFPFINISEKKIIRGSIELADSLLALPEITWENTYQEKRGIPAFRVDSDRLSITCNSNKETCPIYILKSFTKKKNKLCKNAGCTNVHEDVFFQRGQKMIDTMIACDLQYCSMVSNVVKVLLISSDTDLIPAIVYSSFINNSKPKFILGFDEQKDIAISRYKLIFPNYNIKTIEYEF